MLLSIREVAALCGVKDKKTVWRWIMRGYLPAQRAGRQWVIRAEDAERWKAQRTMARR